MALIATQIPADLFEYIAKNAGVIASAFDVETHTLNREDIVAATTGGINFSDKPEYTDFGEDIDNCPKGTMELMEYDSREVLVSGTYVSITPETVKDMIGIADATETKVTPRNEVKLSDFKKLWFIFDWGKGGYIAIELDNMFSTGGFTVQTGDKSKGQFAFEYKAHYSISDPDKEPYEIHFKKGETA